MKPKTTFKKEYVEDIAYRLDVVLIGVFSHDTRGTVKKKSEIIEKELKIAWLRGYKEALKDKLNTK